MNSRIEFVLVGPEHPGNVGSVARAIQNMGFERLVVVDGSGVDWAAAPQARAMACSAREILETARIVESLDEAIAHSHRVVGTTRRRRDERGPDPIPIDRLAPKLARSAVAGESVSILFGCESVGLRAADLARCHDLVTLPTAGEHPSLNLAQAVLLVAYELHRASAETGDESASGPLPATEAEVQGLLDHAETALRSAGVLDSDTPAGRFETLRRMLLRRRPNRAEVKLLRGIFRALERS